ncbi:MAG: peptidoglycan DD-metalloendopeptidase family protein [Oscillospiraceae bacterium]|nr:peptidoglycan DD-metalloendopeptidase family protein [Oscillospiraceae bacterium]
MSTTRKALKRKIAILLSLVLLCAVFMVPSYAGNHNDEIARLQQEADRIARENSARAAQIAELQGDIAREDSFIKEVNKQIEQIGAQVDAYIELIDAKQQAINGIIGDIEQKGREIYEAEHNITRKENEIERLDEENNRNIEVFGSTVAQMYMNSGGDAISLLTGSTSFYDILVRAEMIRTIGEKNNELMEDLLAKIEQQEEEIAELQKDIEDIQNERRIFEEQQRNFEAEKEKLEEERAVVTEEINKQYKTLRELTAGRDDIRFNVRNLEGQISDAAAELSEIDKRIAELEELNRRIEEELRYDHSQNPDRPSFSGQGFIWPLSDSYRMITCAFGCSASNPCGYCSYGWRGSSHTGVDVGNSGIGGASVFAMRSGTVTFAGWKGCCHTGYGVTVIIDHGDGVSTLYAHMQAGSLAVSANQFVEQGQVVGRVGSTGHSTGNHLHFEVRVNGTATNPMGYL